MSDMKHTPEPWVINSPHDVENMKFIYSTDKGWMVFAISNTDRGRADAERIVACVNAMAGIEKPAEFIEKLKNADMAFFEAIDLELQRDELIESLVDILARFKSCISGGNGELEDDRPAINRAESAIAKAKGDRS